MDDGGAIVDEGEWWWLKKREEGMVTEKWVAVCLLSTWLKLLGDGGRAKGLTRAKRKTGEAAIGQNPVKKR